MRTRLRRLVAIMSGSLVTLVALALLPAEVAATRTPAASHGPGYPTPSAAARAVKGSPLPSGPPPPRKTSPHYPGKTAQPSVGYTSFSHTVRSGRSYTTQIFTQPHFRQTAAGWQPIDPTIRPTGNAQQPLAAEGAVRPIRFGNRTDLLVQFELAGGTVTLQAPGLSIGSPALTTGKAVYSGVAPSTDLQYTLSNGTLTEGLLLQSPAAPHSFGFHLSDPKHQLGGVHAEKGGGYRFDGKLASDVGIEIAAPFAYEQPAQVNTPIAVDRSSAHLQVTAAGDGYDIAESVDESWLKGKRYPIVLDPTVTFPNANGAITNVYASEQSGCGGSACGVSRGIILGTDSNVWYAAVKFDLSSIPADYQVTDAEFNAYRFTCFANYSCTLPAIELHPENNYWDYNSTAGDIFNGVDPGVITSGYAGAGNGWQTYDTTYQAQRWVEGLDNNNGFVMKLPTDTLAQGGAFYYSDQDSQDQPYLQVTYQDPNLGEQSWYKFETFPLSDKMALEVNVANGNLDLHSRDFQIQGAGLNLAVDRFWQSEDWYIKDFGNHSEIGTGRDVTLESRQANTLTLYGVGSTDDTFTWNGSAWVAPPSIDADLTQSGSNYVITFHKSGVKWTFASNSIFLSDSERNGNTIGFGYNSGYSLTNITDTEGRQMTVTYVPGAPNAQVQTVNDLAGNRVTQYSYDANGNLQTVLDANGQQTTFGYSGDLLTSITSPGSRVTDITYTGYGNVASITRIADPKHGTGPTTSYTYYRGYTTSTDPNGHTTRYDYDKTGKVTGVTDPLGHQRQASYTSDYNIAQISNATSQVTTLGYDDNNNFTQIQAPASANGQSPASIHFGYQAAGHPFLPSSQTDAQGNCRAYFYDAAGNLSDTYDGQPSGCDNQTGGAHLHDAYQGDSGVNCGAKTGELCSTTDAKGNVTNYGYDANGNVTSITPPAPLGGTTIVPDAVSRQASVTDGKGQKTTYSYDNLDRTTQILYGGATSCSSAATCTTFRYDPDGNLVSRSDATGTTAFAYDQLNRLIKESLPDTSSACAGSGLTFSYDDAGNLTSYCDSGGTVTYGYDAGNRLTSLTEPGGSCTGTVSLCTTFGYDNDDRRTQTTYPGGATLTATYDNAGNQTSIVGKNSGGGVISSFSYVYAKGTVDTGQRQSMTEADPVFNGTTSYTYDVFNRLTQAAGGPSGTLNYGYDLNGNRTSDNRGSYTYNGANELTSAPGASTWNYDANGNLVSTSWSNQSYTYNAQNQTTSISSNGVTQNMAYADVGQIQRVQAGNISYVNAPLGSVGSVMSSKNSSGTTYYTRDNNGNLVGERLPNGSSYYYLFDALGSVVGLISGSGVVANSYGYDPYGVPTHNSETVANPWHYAGGLLDPTGQYKFGDRYYKYNFGIWSQGNGAGGLSAGCTSRYQYANDNPVNSSDPTGHWCQPLINEANWLMGWAFTFYGWARYLPFPYNQYLLWLSMEFFLAASWFYFWGWLEIC